MDEMVGTPRMIKLLNKDVIAGIIKTEGPITKPEIAKITNLSLVTVNKTVDVLLSENKVKVSEVKDSSVGRRAQYFEINEELYYIIGLHYECNVYLGAVANSIGEIIYRQEFPVETGSYERVMEDTWFALDSLVDYCKNHEIAAIGLGVPGVVKDGIVSNIPTIPHWEGLDVAKLLEERYGTVVCLENDINLAAIGVYNCNYKETVDNLALIYLEQGIGCGLILNRELFKGSTNFAGELSYLPVEKLSVGGEKSSRYRGAFEQTVVRLEQEIREASGSRKKELKSLLRSTVANGLLSLSCLINPEVIVLVCSQLSKNDVKLLEEPLKDWIGEENLPKLVRLENIREQSMKGLLTMCIREITPTYSLSSRKRG